MDSCRQYWTLEEKKSGRLDWFYDVIRCCCTSLPICPHNECGQCFDHALCDELCGRVGGDTQPYPMTSPDRPGLLEFSLKTWVGLGTRLYLILLRDKWWSNLQQICPWTGQLHTKIINHPPDLILRVGWTCTIMTSHTHHTYCTKTYVSSC